KMAGMRVATVATGGDPSHLPARKAYEKAGFNVQIPSVWYCRTL
ncbi:MAG: GNAT family N-acetyltransferase, partial [Pseudomonadota bacterium]